MSYLEFTVTIQIQGVNPYVLVGQTQAQSLKPGWRKPMPVVVQINGQPTPPWHINMMPRGDGSYYLYLHGNVRNASQTQVGDTVEVKVQFDTSYKEGPTHPIPEWFAKALSQNQAATDAWNALIPSRQKEIVRSFARLKSDAAKQRNLTQAMYVLSGNAGRFMGRDWKGGR